MREHERSVQPWGTLEELLLACAVSRHGTARWDSVAMELLSRTSSSVASAAAIDLTPETCRHRFDHLKRRFSLSNDETESAGLLVDRLTKIRVDELRRDLRRCDSSIVSLELKVKRLEEERETSLKTEKDSRVESTEKKDDENRRRRRTVSKSEDSNRSFDESNSTTQTRGDSSRKRSSAAPEKSAAKPEPDTNDESDPARDDEEEDNEAVVMMRESNNNNKDNYNNNNNINNNDNNNTNSAKQSSEVQSSTKRHRRGGGGGEGEDCDGGEEVSPAIATSKRLSTIKSEPLIGKLLGMVHSHRLGSVFQRRLRSQESQRYKNMIRQHIDLQTIEARLEKGVYSDGLNKFFRDLLLLFTNAVVFFRKGSQEHVAAKELRSRVLKEMKNNDNTNNNKKVGKSKISTVIIKQEPKSEVDGNVVVPKPKSKKSSIIVTCGGKRNTSSTTIKAISGGSNKKGGFDDKKGRELSVAEVDKESGKVDESRKFIGSSFEDKVDKKKRISQEPSIGRRGLKNNSGSTTSTNNSDELTEREFGGNELSSHDADKVVKGSSDVKKEIATKKKQGVASFLKRMKQNSPKKEAEEGDENDNVSGEEDDSGDEDGGSSKVEKEEEEEEEKKNKGHSNKSKKPSKSFTGDQRVTRNSTKERDRNKGKRGVGRPPKKPEKASGKRGRENRGDHQPRKRSRR